MAFEIKGRVKGSKEVVSALNRAPKIFFFGLRRWMKDERANMLGGKDSSGKERKGYREILSNTRRKKRPGKWSKKVAHLFRGSIPFANDINHLNLKY